MSQPKLSTKRNSTQRIVLVTGMSGAGRSTALKLLEDLGYEAIDNLPLSLLPLLIHQNAVDQLHVPLAIGIDVRAHDFHSERFQETLTDLKDLSSSPHVQLLYLDSDTDVLQRRYTETRRRHPVARKSLFESIEAERLMILPLQEAADVVIDTSQISVSSFGRMIREYFKLKQSPTLFIHLMSFSYRRGLPREADIVFDARFLTNPHYEPPLRALTGQDKPVANFLEKEELWGDFFETAKKMLALSLIGFRRTGKSYLTIACGCTGGQHRSVFMTERLFSWLQEQGETVAITHRELPIIGSSQHSSPLTSSKGDVS